MNSKHFVLYLEPDRTKIPETRVADPGVVDAEADPTLERENKTGSGSKSGFGCDLKKFTLVSLKTKFP